MSAVELAGVIADMPANAPDATCEVSGSITRQFPLSAYYRA